MFNTKVPLYGVCMLLSIIFGTIVSYINSKHLKLDKTKRIAFIMYIILGTIFGGKYFTYFTHINEYKNFNFMKIGYSSYGGILGILILLYIFSKQYKIKYEKLILTIIPSIPLMYSLGKIGCFLAGCCHGIEYQGILSITYKYSYIAPNNISLFPVQLIESISFLTIFILIMYMFKKRKTKNIICITFILCGFTKFILDYLRISHKGVIISINQIVSLLFVIIGIILMITQYTKNGKKSI